MHNGSNWLCMTPNGPNDPKTLPMGILHDYMSCWTTLGPFQRPTEAPKQVVEVVEVGEVGEVVEVDEVVEIVGVVRVVEGKGLLEQPKIVEIW